MTTHAPAVGRTNRPNLVAVGTIVWLSSELMFFAALFAMYFTSRSVQGPAKWADSVSLLNIPFSAVNTTVLVLSSVTCQFGVFAAERFQNSRTGSIFQLSKWGMREWFALTFAMGAFFIGGQVFEYTELVHKGLTISSVAYGSVFYLATGFHGLHVTFGLVLILSVLWRSRQKDHYSSQSHFGVEAAELYWHFVDVVWIILFLLVYILR